MDLRPRTLGTAALILAALLAGCEEGESAYEDGRFEDACAAFAKAVEDAGDEASPELRMNLALAALRAGDLSRAEQAAKEAGAAGGPDLAAFADFLRGNAAFARAETAARQADTPEAEPFAWDVAIRYAEGARDLWIRAATHRRDWPAARRNVERALLRIEEFRGKQREAESRRARPSEPNPVPGPPPPPDPRPGSTTTEEEVGPEAALLALTPEQVRGLFERLAEKEREKIALRREERKTRMAEVEKDW